MKKTNKLLVAFASLGMVIAGGAAATAVKKNVAQPTAATTNVRTLSFNFYDSTKLTTTSGTTATLAIAQGAMDVPSGATAANVLTASTFTNAYNGKVGGLSFGTSSKVGSWAMTLASGYEVVKVELVGTAYDTGSSFTLNGNAGDGSLGVNKTAIASVTTKLSWALAAGTTSITIASTPKRATIYTLNLYYGKVNSIAISGTPTKASYYAGDTFDHTGLTVTATYSVGLTADVTSECVWTPDPLAAGNTAVTASYTYGSTVTAIYTGITTAARTLQSIAITTKPTRLSYSSGDTFDTTGLVVTGHYNVGSDIDVTDQCTLSTPNGTAFTDSNIGTITVTVSATGVTSVTFDITVSASTIEFLQKNKTYYNGKTKTVSGTVTKIFNDYSSKYDLFIQDGNYACEVYQLADLQTNVALGALVKASGTVSVYNGLLELASATVTYVSAGNTITPFELTETNYNATDLALMDGRLVTGTFKYVSGSLASGTSAASVSLTIGTTSATFRSATATQAVAISPDYALFFACTGTTTEFTWTGILSWYNGPQLAPSALSEVTCASVFDGINAVVTALDMSSTTANQCLTKYASAKNAYNALSTEQKALFNGATTYTDASARYAAWAKANGETVSAIKLGFAGDNSTVSMIAVLASMAIVLAGGAYLYIRRRKQA
jgi:hypothetical protein